MNKEKIEAQPARKEENERSVDPRTGIVLTPKESEGEKRRKEEDPNWWREQK
jgi:hypothetical protein